MAFYQLLYSNRSTTNITANDLEALTKTMQRTHRDFGISGFLVFHQDTFIHLIEGDKETVLSLAEEAKNNPQYAHFDVLLEQESQHRHMLTWGVGSSLSESLNHVDFYLPLDDTRHLCSTMEGEIGQIFMKFLGDE